MAHLTNVSFEFFHEIFKEDASLLLLYHGAKKSKMTKNSNQGGYCVRKKRPRTGVSRGNDRDAICAFKFAPSRHAFDLHTFLRLIRALCRSLVVEGSVVRS